MKNILASSLIFAILFTNCKKGEGDSLISLKSRKGMISGAWTLTKGTINIDLIDLQNGEQFSGMYNIEGTTLTGTEYTFSTLRDVQDKFILNLDFNRDGIIKIREQSGRETFESTGNWDFTNGVGKEKKKESIVIRIENVSSSKTYRHFFNQFGGTFRYRIKELKNNSMVLTCSEVIAIDANGSQDKIMSEFTFKK